MEPRIPLRWGPRDVPLPASAVVATGRASRALGRRLAGLANDALASLAAVAGEDVLVVLGERSALPWVDGVMYLGREDAAPELLLPTALTPNVPVGVLAAAIRALGPRPAPVAVMPSSARLIPCGAALAIDRERLARWLERP